MTTLVVIAKECRAGKVKTRLHPPLSLAGAARVAEASLTDTLAAVAELPATRRILYFDGERPPAAARDYEVVQQVAGNLDERLAVIFDRCREPTVLIGMDTPQLTAGDFAGAFEAWPSGVDALFGPAVDGGFWALGMATPRGDLVRGVPMSRDDSGRRQRSRLVAAGLAVQDLPTLRDIDRIADLIAVSGGMGPGSLTRAAGELGIRERAR